MKRFLILLIATIYSAAVWSEDINALVLHRASGEQVICMLYKRPVIMFKGESIEISICTNEGNLHYTDVVKLTYTNKEITANEKLTLIEKNILRIQKEDIDDGELDTNKDGKVSVSDIPETIKQIK